MYADYFEALGRVSGNLAHGDDAFIDTFAPDPPDDDEKALGLFMDFVGLGTTVGISGLFKGGMLVTPLPI